MRLPRRHAVFACFVLALALLLSSAVVSLGQGALRERMRERFASSDRAGASSAEKTQIAGVEVAVWRPAASYGVSPLVIFSHGFHGSDTQSLFLMKALAQAGYLVIAPNHADAIGHGHGNLGKPEESFYKPSGWTENTYRNRGNDVIELVDALHKDSAWNSQIDWSKFALAGHSLGGYTALALAGAWPSWKLPGVKAVLALSPYSEPFVVKDTLKNITVPIMYQGGTRDFGITPLLKRPNGAFSRTQSPAYFVEFDGASHFSFSNFNRDQDQEKLIIHYSLAFLDKYLKNDPTARPEQRLAGVSELEVK